MTKARARERAKDNALKKAKKRIIAKAAQTDDAAQTGQFDPGARNTTTPRMNPSSNNFTGAKRGSARSK